MTDQTVRCGNCGAPLRHVNEACDFCLPGFNPGLQQPAHRAASLPDEVRGLVERLREALRIAIDALRDYARGDDAGDTFAADALERIARAALSPAPQDTAPSVSGFVTPVWGQTAAQDKPETVCQHPYVHGKGDGWLYCMICKQPVHQCGTGRENTQ